ncbi:Uncharacterized protein ycf72 [Geodia barretti]|uniref:Uncharacterized protein ycf72 n=1 Tax=Geodia barretti TaxID=519541 RepID=A0AA35WLC5_GEOBA|nr:Uncharacterized protein ycf72 [Geodia barretti]
MTILLALPTCPSVAIARTRTRRTSPEGSRIRAYLPSLSTNCAAPPALRTSWPPLPGCISILWIDDPSGILSSGKAFPTRISASAPEVNMSPT